MTKEEAAAYLGVSSRTIERYVKDGKLTVRYEKSANGEMAIFDAEQLEEFKNNRETPRIKPAIADLESDAPSPPTTIDKGLSMVVGAGIFAPLTSAIDRLIASLTPQGSKPKLTPNQLQGKLLLTLDECRVLTGLSRETLRQAIKEGNLPAQIIGKSWRVKAKDLENYIERL
jgi:excisionase family DNA binding protein